MTLRVRAGAARALAVGLGTALLLGCATPPPPAAEGRAWSGRLALAVDDARQTALSAGFDLRGSPRAGELILLSPVGLTLARLSWAPGEAVLRAGGEEQRFDSLQALASAATGTELPLAALFDWLDGRPTPVPGWEVDLSGLAQGRLLATRASPPPAARLRLALER